LKIAEQNRLFDSRLHLNERSVATGQQIALTSLF
jgi:hypothetical protein